MLWIGTQAAIEAAAVLCDAATSARPQTRGDGTPVPEAERMQMSWAVAQQCPHCALWTLQAPPDEYGVTKPSNVTEMTSAAFEAAHAGSDVPKTTHTYTACAVVRLTLPRTSTGDLSLLLAPSAKAARVLSVEISSSVSAAWQLEKRQGPDTGGRASNVLPLAYDGSSPAAESRVVAYGDASPSPAAVLGLITLPTGSGAGKVFTSLDPSGFRLAAGEALAVQCGAIAAAEIKITWTWAEDRQA